jgi:putative cardiolipin synthase
VLTGGRNIANDYFDLSDHYNFLDSDLEVTGPIVKTVLQSFDVYWNSRLATEPALDSEPNDEAARFVVPQAVMSRCSSDCVRRASHTGQSHRAHECQDLRFVTDFPNQGEKSRNVFNAIVDELRRAKQEAGRRIAVLRDQKRRLRRARRPAQAGRACPRADQQPRVHRRFVRRCRALSPARLTGRYRPHALRRTAERRSPRRAPISGGGTPRWGVHSKRGVIDGETTLLGTYNIDPRSANLNSELMLVCRGQKDLAAEVLASIAAREAASGKVIERGTIVQRSALLGSSPLTHRIRFLLEMPIANLFDFLL